MAKKVDKLQIMGNCENNSRSLTKHAKQNNCATLTPTTLPNINGHFCESICDAYDYQQTTNTYVNSPCDTYDYQTSTDTSEYPLESLLDALDNWR